MQIRAADITRESWHEAEFDMEFWRTNYHFKVALQRQSSMPGLPPIKFEGSSNDSQLQFLVTRGIDGMKISMIILLIRVLGYMHIHASMINMKLLVRDSGGNACSGDSRGWLDNPPNFFPE